MRDKARHIILRLHPKHVSALLTDFLKDESISGKLILAATVISLVVVNSPLADTYGRFWHTPLSLGIGSWSLSLDLRHWLNEGLMAFFFLLVGLEIKRELVKGELREFRTAILPIGAAIGGMAVPALVYLFFNTEVPYVRGWGIPIATDIAFAIAILTLLGHRVPVSLKIFLLTLAIADDIGAIIVIALFYAEIIHYGYLFASIALLVGLFLLRKHLRDQLFIVAVAGIVLWVTTHLSGIHASIVGVAIGLLVPVAEGRKASMSERIEKLFLPLTTFAVLPLFAFANAGFVLTSNALGSNTSVLCGIIFGLVFGKVVGITLASWLLTKFGIAKLPDSIRWSHIIGVGFLAGIGFTVSIFITELAFADHPDIVSTSKAGIFIASGVSAALGAGILALTHRRHRTN